jgi:hypothetical protein
VRDRDWRNPTVDETKNETVTLQELMVRDLREAVESRSNISQALRSEIGSFRNAKIVLRIDANSSAAGASVRSSRSLLRSTVKREPALRKRDGVSFPLW